MRYLQSILVVGVVIFMGMGNVKAQEGAFKIGVLVGPQNSWLFNQDDSDAGQELDYQTTFRFAGGITASYNFTDYIGVGIDLLYSSQGQKYKGLLTGPNYAEDLELTGNTTLNYFKVPVLFRVNSNPDAIVQFTGFVGPQISFLLGYKDEVTWTGKTSGNKITSTVEGTTITTRSEPSNSLIDGTTELTEKIYSGIDFGACLGFGATFLLSDNLQLNALLRFDYGFLDVENKNAAYKDNPDNKFWEGVKPKYAAADNANYQRPKTSNATGAFVVGISYLLGY